MGRYCQVCGQENLEPKETVWHLVSHFLNDVTHFDGKFFATLRLLLLKPGFLSSEYIRGRRASYLHPIRMYVFTSAIFFLVFFSIHGSKDVFNVKEETPSYSELHRRLDKLERALATEKDSAGRAGVVEGIESLKSMVAERNMIVARRAAKGEDIGADTLGLYKLSAGAKAQLDSLISGIRSGAIPVSGLRTTKMTAPIEVEEDTTEKGGVDDNRNWGFGDESLPGRVSEYDSMEAAKPPQQRPSGLTRYLNRHLVALNEHYHSDKQRFVEESKEGIMHTFPKVLFVSLPLFAAFLRLMNLRKKRRREFFYVDHGIFTIHLYVATFILMLVLMLLQRLEDNIHQHWLTVVETLLFLSIFVYEYIAMKKFYKQGWFKTLVKMCILNTLSSITIGILTAIFAAWAIIQL
jgi:hypothetical protein